MKSNKDVQLLPLLLNIFHEQQILLPAIALFQFINFASVSAYWMLATDFGICVSHALGRFSQIHPSHITQTAQLIQPTCFVRIIILTLMFVENVGILSL